MEYPEGQDWLNKVQYAFDHPATVLWRAVELRHVAEALGSHELKDPILDLGCAEGKIASLLFDAKKLIGLDNCPGLLMQNRKSQVYRALVLADACRMPFKDNYFGSVFSNCVIEHISSLDDILNEVFRVLKKKGVFLFTVPSDKFGDFLFFTAVFNRLRLGGLARWYKTKRNRLLKHFHCYEHNRWEHILREKGFKMVGHRYYLSQRATFIWDFLAAAMFIFRSPRLLNLITRRLNKRIIRYLRPYYNMDCEMGGALLIIALAEKQE